MLLYTFESLTLCLAFWDRFRQPLKETGLKVASYVKSLSTVEALLHEPPDVVDGEFHGQSLM